MAVHDELRPDSEQLPYLMASDAMRMARGLESRSMGYLGIPDADGSETIIGPEQNGTTVVPWVGDTTAPGRPLGVTATSDMQCAIVRWDGKLEGGIPSDFRCVTVYAMRLESETDYDTEHDGTESTAAVVDTITLGDLTAAGEVASGILEVGDTYDIWAVAYDDAHDRYGNPAYNASAESAHVQVTIVPLVTREQMEQTAQEILDGAKASADAQIKQVEATMDEISDAVASNTDAITIEQTLREEGDKAAQATAAAVKAETDKLKGDYAGMATDVAAAQQDIVKLATQTGNLAETTIVRSIVEYAVGTGATAPTSGWSTATPSVTGSQRAWMRTTVTYGDGRTETTSPVVVTGEQGAPGAAGAPGAPGVSGAKGDKGDAGVSVTAITPFYCIAASKPAQPTDKAPGGAWTTTEPAYVKDRSLYTCQRVDYSNGQWSWTSVQLSSSYGLASVALMTANGKNKRYVQKDAPSSADLQQSDEWWQTSSKPLETYWTGEPNNSPSVLVDHSDEVEHIYVWNGSRWNEQLLSAQYLIVPGTISAGLVTAQFFDGAVVKGGAFLTSNERIKLTNDGFVMVDASGHPLVTLDATTGTATFQDVHIIDGALSAPTVSGGTFNGGEYNILDASGKLIASINSSGVVFGDSLAYGYDSKLKRWTLTLDGALMSKGELSGVTVIGSTIATNREDKTGIKMTDGGLVAYRNKTPVFEVTADGDILMDGGISSNLTIKAARFTGGTVVGTKIKTLEADKRGVELEGRKLVAYNDSGQELLSLNGSGAGEALLTGGVRTARSGNHVRVRSQAFASGGQTKYKGIVGGYIDDTLMWGISGDTTTLDGSSRLDLYLNPQAPDIYLERQANGITNGSWWSNHLFFHARQWSATDKPSKAGGDILLSALGADGSTTGNLVVDYTDVSMWAINGNNEKRLIVAPDKVTINGHRIDNLPDMYCGSTVITPSGNGNRHTLFTQAQWKSITGLDDPGARNPLVLVSNGDTDARNVAMVGAGYSGKTKTWYVYLSNSVNKGDVFRVNYCILIRQ